MCSPSQVLGDVYTEVLEAAHPLHRGPTDHKRSALIYILDYLEYIKSIYIYTVDLYVFVLQLIEF